MQLFCIASLLALAATMPSRHAASAAPVMPKPKFPFVPFGNKTPSRGGRGSTSGNSQNSSSIGISAPGSTCAAFFNAEAASRGTCSCLATCRNNRSCCADFEQFHAGLEPWLKTQHLWAEPYPAYEPNEKYDMVAVDRTFISGGVALVTLRQCLMHRCGAGPKSSTFSQGGVPDCPNVSTMGGPTAWTVKECEPAFEVIAVRPDLTLQRFEEAVSVPAKLRISAGYDPAVAPPDLARTSSRYYAEVEGRSAVAAAKQALVPAPLISGFSARLAPRPNGKLAWDPTPNRAWHVESATFTIAGRMSTQGSDIPAAALDASYEAVAERGFYTANPWTSGCVLSLSTNGGADWRDLVDQKGNRVTLPSL